MGLYAKHIFPRVLDWSLGGNEISRLRTAALESVSGEVLEVGFGTGLNLAHYPPTVTRLTAIDQEDQLPDRVASRIAAAHFPIDRKTLDASRRLPFGDASFDAVVTTWTLCSIEQAVAALREVHRVLRDNGR